MLIRIALKCSKSWVSFVQKSTISKGWNPVWTNAWGDGMFDALFHDVDCFVKAVCLTK